MKKLKVGLFMMILGYSLMGFCQTEEEIPVSLEPPKKAAANESSVLKFGLAFGIIGIVGCASFLFLRKYKFQNTKTDKMQIKLLTQHYLGPKKSLAIIRVAGESVLIGITDHNINLIKSLSLLDEEIPEEVNAPSAARFDSVFNKVDAQNPQEKDSAATFRISEAPIKRPAGDESEDEFAISGIRDLVSGKLKNMRNI